MGKPTLHFTTTEHSYINFIQEVSYTILLNSINKLLMEDYGQNINKVLEYLAEGEAGHHSKLTITELSSILVGELQDIFREGEKG